MINPPSPPRANSDELDPLHPLFTLPAQTPAVGAVRMLGGQRYTMVSLVAHRRRDGAFTTLVCWRSHCAACGAAFQFAASIPRSIAVRLNRRCSAPHSRGRVARLIVKLDPSP